jgi:uncharacterized membrane protein YhdT
MGQARTRKPIRPTSLSKHGRILIGILLFFFALIWAVGLYAYFTLPERVPTHFGFSGKPDSFGTKSIFLLLPLAFSIAPLIFLVVIKYRFTLINRYPYLINLPAFFAIFELPSERRGYWLNRYFELVLVLGVALVVFLLVILLGTYKGTLDGGMPSWFSIVMLFLPFLLIVPFIVALRSLALKMAEEGEAG